MGRWIVWILIGGICCYVGCFHLYGSSTTTQQDGGTTLRRSSMDTSGRNDGFPKAMPIYGIRRLIPPPQLDDGSPIRLKTKESSPIEIVYSTSIQSEHSPRGIALLLHACTHNAQKFFSASNSLDQNCPDCVGLSEELHIVRLVQERNYIPLAITCADRNSGCWSDRDIPRIEHALHVIRHDERLQKYSPPSGKNRLTILAIGASSGGHMAATLAAKGIVDAALVMVMGLRPKLQDLLIHTSNNNNKHNNNKITSHGVGKASPPPLYLAPMSRDQRTLKRTRENYQALIASQYGQPMEDDGSGGGDKRNPSEARVILDETSCRPLPVTIDYLMERVVGMTPEYAHTIIAALKASGHVGDDDSLFRIDPTTSDWRTILLRLDAPSQSGIRTKSKRNSIEIQPTMSSPSASSSSSSLEILWGQFALTRGYSPLAKSFHRAWAFHEYCSEAVVPALDFFERVLL